MVAPWIKNYYNIDGANYVIPNIGEACTKSGFSSWIGTFVTLRVSHPDKPADYGVTSFRGIA